VLLHVVLFRPRPGLSADGRRGLVDALALTLKEVSSIRRVRIGRRVTHGRPYEHLMRQDYQYAAVLEFDDLAGLKAYLEHPAHDTLAVRFFAVVEEALMYDFEVKEGEEGLVDLL
jgi:hypothetical protein